MWMAGRISPGERPPGERLDKVWENGAQSILIKLGVLSEVPMRKTMIWAGLVGLLALAASPIARGCGDRTLALLYGVRFGQAFKAPRPASIIIYTAGSSGTALGRDTELQKA